MERLFIISKNFTLMIGFVVQGYKWCKMYTKKLFAN